MGREIRTRRIEKNIKVLDKSAVAAEHLKHVYVRSKDSTVQTQQEQEKGGNRVVEYAENKITAVAGLSIRQSVHGAKKISSSAGSERYSCQSKKWMKNTERAGQEQREQAGRVVAQEKAGQKTAQEQTKRWKPKVGAEQTVKFSGKMAESIGREGGRVVFKSGRSVKTFEQSASMLISPVRAQPYWRRQRKLMQNQKFQKK